MEELWRKVKGDHSRNEDYGVEEVSYSTPYCAFGGLTS